MRTVIKGAAAAAVAAGSFAFATSAFAAPVAIGNVTAEVSDVPSVISPPGLRYAYTGSGNPVTGGLFDTTRPAFVGDIGTLSTGTVIDPGERFQVTAATVARVQGPTAGNADIIFLLFDDVNPGAAAGTPVMSNLVGSARFSRTVAASTGASVLTTGLTFSPGVFLTDATFGYAMLYVPTGSTVNIATNGQVTYTANTIGMTAFYQDRADTGEGSTTNGFYSDTNADGILDASEFGAFAAPNDVKSNLFLSLSGEVVAIPEPASLSLLGLGALGLVRRRRA
jgi:hypothetical protein